jgi:hypothetical protein
MLFLFLILTIEATAQAKQQALPIDTRPFLTHGEWVMAILTTFYVVISYFGFRAIKRQADIAEKPANAVVNAEAAWIMVKITLFSGTGAEAIRENEDAGRKTTSAFITCHCQNRGNTPGTVIEKRIGLATVTSLPTKPDLSGTIVFQAEPELLAGGQESHRHFDIGGNPREFGKTTIIYGIVRYRDVFDRDRYTTFGYMLSPDKPPRIERIPNYPQYNENT